MLSALASFGMHDEAAGNPAASFRNRGACDSNDGKEGLAMPLRDHFRPPLDDLTSWEGFHGGWPMMIV
jgi:hypothetical protein